MEQEQVFATTNDIPDPEAMDDARCLLDAYRMQDTEWHLRMVEPQELAVRLGGIFVGEDKDRLRLFAAGSRWEPIDEDLPADYSLVESVRDHGVEHPIVVLGELFEGNHRLAAALVTGRPLVPVLEGTVPSERR